MLALALSTDLSRAGAPDVGHADHETDAVDQKKSQYWGVEEYELTIYIIFVDEANLMSNPRVKARLLWHDALPQTRCYADDDGGAPPENGVGQKSFEVCKDDEQLHPFESPYHVKAENSHPAEHGEIGINTKVAEYGAKYFFSFLLRDLEVVDNDQISGRHDGWSRAADQDLAMQVVQLREPPVDEYGDEERGDADRAKPGVNFFCNPVTSCCVLSDLVENSAFVSKDASEAEAGEK